MFYCNFCNHETEILKEHLDHHKFHRNITDLFHCGFNKCKFFFKNEKYLRTHLIRKHALKSDRRMENYDNFPSNNEGKFTCTLQICEKIFDDFSSLLKHMKVHIYNKQEIKCPYSGCDNKYKVISSFSSHITKIHRKITKSEIVPDENFYSSDKQCNDDISCLDACNNHSNLESIQTENTSDLFLKNLAQFYLQLECKFHLPATTIQYVIDELKNIRSLEKEYIKPKLREFLLEKNIAIEAVEEIVEEIVSDGLMTDSNEKFNSNFKRKKYYKKEFNFVNPVLMQINEKDYFSYIPIEKTLENFFYDKSVHNHLNFNINMNKPDEILEDFTDGNVFKKNNFFKQHPTALKIILYQDSFEVVNPIGAAKKKHKILAIYMNLGNIADHLRSHIDTIKLVALCKEKNFDHHIVYGKLVSDLKKIELEGIDVNGRNYKGSVVFIAGDNLGSHALGGFIENFSTAIYFCRFCLITRDQFHSENGCCSIGELRSVESYKESVQSIGDERSNNGIKFDSAFNQLNHYHVSLPGLPPCLAHDLFEGVVAYDLKLCINNLIIEKWFSLQYLNKKIDEFSYSTEDRRDKPSIINDSDRIVGGACQIWTFLRVFPFLIENKINTNSDVWRLIMLLSEIVEIICSPTIHSSILPYLELLITDYITARRLAFPNNRLRPKHHFLLHYPQLILEFGPLIKVWTLRYESKHSYFKKTVRFLHNFINFTKTLSIKHELLQCLVRLGSDIRMEIDMSEISHFDLKLYNQSIQNAIIKCKLLHDVQQCNKVVYKGTEYKKGYVVAVRQNTYRHDIVFGKISFFIYHKNEIFILFEILENMYLPYLGAYEIGTTLLYECINIRDLVYYKPLYVYNTGQNLYIKPHHGFVYHHL